MRMFGEEVSGEDIAPLSCCRVDRGMRGDLMVDTGNVSGLIRLGVRFFCCRGHVAQSRGEPCEGLDAPGPGNLSGEEGFMY